jgi:hypothetical protein
LTKTTCNDIFCLALMMRFISGNSKTAARSDQFFKLRSPAQPG